MAQFRKKPVVVEAFQVTANNRRPHKDWPAWASEAWNKEPDEDGAIWPSFDRGILIRTLEGAALASIGDWIIRGIKGELYPCKPDIFAATYEPVD